MQAEQLEMLKNLQAHQFTAFDFVLYLDTHPCDQRALADYSCIQKETERLQDLYTMNYGPLMSEDSVDQPYWRWIEEPWPWEIEY